jgi:pimeloyl-ACP methyl ester carboxylesterase
MDARGHGDSARPGGDGAYHWLRFGEDAGAVARVLAEAHGGGRIALGLGHSFGGTALLMAAAAEPQRFASLVLVDPVLPPPPGSTAFGERPPRGESLSERAGRRREIFGSREEAGATWAEKPLFAGWDPRAFALYLAEGLRDRPDGQVELKCAAAVESAIFGNAGGLDAWAVAARVATPTLLLWAERGDFPRSVFESVASRMADARIRDVPTGHLVPMERPELVAELALAFAAEHAQAGSALQRSTG